MFRNVIIDIHISEQRENILLTFYQEVSILTVARSEDNIVPSSALSILTRIAKSPAQTW